MTKDEKRRFNVSAKRKAQLEGIGDCILNFWDHHGYKVIGGVKVLCAILNIKTELDWMRVEAKIEMDSIITDAPHVSTPNPVSPTVIDQTPTVEFSSRFTLSEEPASVPPVEEFFTFERPKPSLRLTKDVREAIIRNNVGFSYTSHSDLRNSSEYTTYSIPSDGQLHIRRKGKCSWADSRYDYESIATDEETRRFIRGHINMLNTDGIV